jgi:hypothetical protein
VEFFGLHLTEEKGRNALAVLYDDDGFSLILTVRKFWRAINRVGFSKAIHDREWMKSSSVLQGGVCRNGDSL